MKPGRSLERDVLLNLGLVAVLASALMLALILVAFRAQLLEERSRASMGVNLLLQASLENAMLKRDVPGLADIVQRLGGHQGIRRVMILNPSGEVRFASEAPAIGRRYPQLTIAGPGPKADAAFVHDDAGEEVLRSIIQVRNKTPCEGCHGAVAAHPVNGVLIVDYEAREIRHKAWVGAVAFSLAGIAVLALILGLLWRLLRRRVLLPVARLSEASADIETGRLDRPVAVSGEDELAGLAARFNRMAARIAAQMAKIRTHETYLQQVLDGLPDGVRVIDAADKRIALANRAYCEQLGVEHAATIGKACYASSHRRESPCVDTLVSCPLVECREEGTRLKATHRHLRADGTTLAVEVHAARIGIGGKAYIVESIRDLTQVARVSHEQRLSELGLLAAGVAHEIHNPLASIRLVVQGLAREIKSGGSEPARVSDYLELVDGEIDNCIAVTRRLLLLSRQPEGRRQIVDVVAAIDDTARLLDFDAQARGIRQMFLPPVAPIHVLADEGELRMVLLNLLQNAHHAMPQGGIVRVSAMAQGGEVAIEVADDGCGIAEEHLEHIFDPFFSRRADGVAGTGLGLTIVKNIVERFGGRIEAASAPGKGACFTVRLPLASSATVEAS